MNATIENNFSYHPPTADQPVKYERLRAKAKELAYLIDEICPNSREKSKAMTELEDAVMWANAAIARNPVPFLTSDSSDRHSAPPRLRGDKP